MSEHEDDILPLNEGEIYDTDFEACGEPFALSDAQIVILVRRSWSDPRNYGMPDGPEVHCNLAELHDGLHAASVNGTWVTWDDTLGVGFVEEGLEYCQHVNDNGMCILPAGHALPHPLNFS